MKKKWSFVWRDREIKNIGDLVNGIASCQTQSDADDFFEAYVRSFSARTDLNFNERVNLAQKNVGYLIGYLDTENRKRLYRLFNTQHPIFGRSDPTPQEALTAGLITRPAGNKML